MNASSIVENGLYVDATMTRWRRVIEVRAVRDERFVIYSTGTESNRCCLLRTLARRAWKRITVDADGIITEVEKETA